MTFWTLALRSLRFHARAHLGVLLGATVGAAVLIGALLVGDSVRGSLREMALARLGHTELSMATGDRLFQVSIVRRLLNAYGVEAKEAGEAAANGIEIHRILAPMLQLQATATTTDDSARANKVILHGVESGFWKLAAIPPEFKDIPQNAVVLNEPLAQQLRARVGQTILLRVAKLAQLSQDISLTPRDGSTLALRLTVHAVLPTTTLGKFGLQANQVSPLNAFVRYDSLAQALDVAGKANLLLVGSPHRVGLLGTDWWSVSSPNHGLDIKRKLADVALRQAWNTTDAQLELRTLTNSPALELRTERIFLDAPAVRAALAVDTNAQPILTYLATLLRAGTNATAYPMVTAAGAPLVPADLRDDEVVINRWLADQLKLAPGGELEMSYFLPDSGAALTEATNRFRVRSIVAMELPWADGTLMPDFPGIAKAERIGDWDAGFPLKHTKLVDDPYWKQWRGTPKAFVSLSAGRKMWANRFGDTTAVRFPMNAEFGMRNAESNRSVAAGQVSPSAPAPSPRPSPPVGEREKTGAVRSIDAGKSNVSSTAAAAKAPAANPLSPIGGEGQGEGARRVPASTPATLTPDAAAAQSAIGNRQSAIEKALLAQLKPADFGLVFQPVREQALKASGEGQDFGGLFIGFSFFLIIAACVLVSLLFQFGIEQRATEVGTLLALGFTPKQVRRLFLLEGAGLSLMGSLLGAAGGVWYAQAMLHALSTVWRDAVGTSDLNFHAGPATLAGGIVGSVLVAVFTLWLALRKQARRPARELLAGGGEGEEAGLASGVLGLGNDARLGLRRQAERDAALGSRGAESAAAPPDGKAPSPLRPAGAVQKRRAFVIGVVCLLGALGLSGWAWAKQDSAAAGIFFGAGALLLGAAMAFTSAFLSRLERSEAAANLTLTGLGIRNATRRRRRSMATVAMLACGSFLIVSIGAFRLDENADATKRASGTGGFAQLGESTLPVVQDLNSQAGREFFNLDAKAMTNVSVVPFRVRDGDDASCLNLNRAQKPRLLGVNWRSLHQRNAFRFAGEWKGEKMGWEWFRFGDVSDEWMQRSKEDARRRANEEYRPSQLHGSLPRSGSATVIPAIADEASILWALGKKLGDTLDFTDERGKPFKVRLVASLAGSVLQGNLIISEDEFTARYPGEAGYRFFLLDAPPDRAADVSAALTKGLRDSGLELVPTTRRLAQFNAVQNTYLGTFQVLGGLGLLLGSAGLGVVVLRNVLDRRGELALLLAVGFRAKALRWLVLSEHAGLLLLGLGAGVVAAAVAVLPALRSGGEGLPLGTLGLTLAGVLVSGLVFTLLATTWSLRGRLLDSLRNQ